MGESGNAGVDTRYRFTGREWDGELQQYYYRARYYDANTGRFIGQDPLGFAAGDSNLYRYVGNSPVMATDPSGEIAFVPALIWAAGVGLGTVAAYTVSEAVVQQPGQTPTSRNDNHPYENYYRDKTLVDLTLGFGPAFAKKVFPATLAVGQTAFRKAGALFDDLACHFPNSVPVPAGGPFSFKPSPLSNGSSLGGFPPLHPESSGNAIANQINNGGILRSQGENSSGSGKPPYWEQPGAQRRAQTGHDVTLPSEAAARREVFRDYRIPARSGKNFKRESVYGQNLNMRGPNGEPYEIIKAQDANGQSIAIQHHSNGHGFPNGTYEFPHYQGRNGRHISYSPN